MAIEERYRQQVDLLVRVLPAVSPEDVFALKGGTAINLFVRNLPRLSVDIDLTYLPIRPRADSLSEIEDALQRISTSIVGALPEAKVFESRLHREGTLNRLVVRTPDTQIKIEVTPVTRGCVFEPVTMPVAPAVEDQFGYAETPVVSFDDLYAGKIVAALDRQHPRDLFDVRDLLANEGISDSLRRALLVYVVSHNRPAAEILAPNRRDLAKDFEDNFVGMSVDPVSLDDLLKTRERLIGTIVGEMPSAHRDFLVGVEKGDPDWSSVGLADMAELPAIRWKLSNLDSLPSERRDALAEDLLGVWR